MLLKICLFLSYWCLPEQHLYQTNIIKVFLSTDLFLVIRFIRSLFTFLKNRQLRQLFRRVTSLSETRAVGIPGGHYLNEEGSSECQTMHFSNENSRLLLSTPLNWSEVRSGNRPALYQLPWPLNKGLEIARLRFWVSY